MEIDWDSAPDGAEMYCNGFFYKHEGSGRLVFYHNDNREYVPSHYDLASFETLHNTSYRPSDKEKPGNHYDNYVKVKVSKDDASKGYVILKVDPHFVSKALDMKGGAMEHIFKKAMRGTSKGHTKLDVFEEIIALAKRGIELEEDVL
jgi:hypothetical protein